MFMSMYWSTIPLSPPGASSRRDYTETEIRTVKQTQQRNVYLLESLATLQLLKTCSSDRDGGWAVATSPTSAKRT